MAGKVDVCLFDKTGTLTTDELVAVGVEGAKPSPNKGPKRSRGSLMDTLVPMLEAPAAATVVLAGCQSLVLMEGSEAGDPVEAAAMKSIKVGRCGKGLFVTCLRDKYSSHSAAHVAGFDSGSESPSYFLPGCSCSVHFLGYALRTKDRVDGGHGSECAEATLTKLFAALLVLSACFERGRGV